jgi:hypothetical protein
MTNPGETREGLWLPYVRIPRDILPSGILVRVTARRGWNCCTRCEHVPPRPNNGGRNHGQHCDEYSFEIREGDKGMTLRCFTWVRDGVVDRPPSFRHELLVYGASAHAHQKTERPLSDPDSIGEPIVQDCPVFGRCEAWFLGYCFSEEFFEPAFTDALAPHIVKPVDDVDFALVALAMGPLWKKMAKTLPELQP